MPGKSKPGWLIACALLPLAACGDKAPGGQVVAVVDGTELTRRELRVELPPGLRGTVGQQGPAVNQALEGLIDRKLLAEEARQMGLETDPEYHFALRQAREQLLVEALQRKLAAEQPTPTPAEISAYITANPWQFAGRRQFVLQPEANTQAAPTVIDSADFVTHAPVWAGTARVGTAFEFDGTRWRVTAIYPLKASVAEQQSRARAVLAMRKRERSVGQMLGKLRNETVIRYQPGFGPSGR